MMTKRYKVNIIYEEHNYCCNVHPGKFYMHLFVIHVERMKYQVLSQQNKNYMSVHRSEKRAGYLPENLRLLLFSVVNNGNTRFIGSPIK